MNNITLTLTVPCPEKNQVLAYLRYNQWTPDGLRTFVNSTDKVSVHTLGDETILLPYNKGFDNPEYYIQEERGITRRIIVMDGVLKRERTYDWPLDSQYLVQPKESQ